MRFVFICLLCLSCLGRAHSQPPGAVERVRGNLEAALPALSAAADPSVTLLSNVDTTALGCPLIDGLPLATPIEAYRLVFSLNDEPFAAQVSADGRMIQPCDVRFPNLGAGTMPFNRARQDSDGDGLVDSADACPNVAGAPALERAGCPFVRSGDRDGDGSADARDHCPDQAGAAATHGCALMRDRDGDGIPNHVDICPADRGISRPDFALGCPTDGSGSSPQRRAADDVCHAAGAGPIYAARAEEADITGELIDELPVIGRTAANDWYQLESGWLRAEAARLSGACYNIPLVNPAPGGATGCFMRPRAEYANVRAAPGGAQMKRISAEQSFPTLGRNSSADWLFYRGGWVNRAVLELSGNCDQLPVLDPATVASGIIHFCPPDYAGMLPPRIDIGERRAQIASSSIASRLRAAPDIAAEQIGAIPPRAVIDAVLDGPACKPPHIWWQVDAGGVIGWTVESDVNFNFYYLEPLAARRTAEQNGHALSVRAPSDREQPAANRIIHSANAQQLDTIILLNIESPQTLAWSPNGSALAVVSESGSVESYSYPDLERMPFSAESRHATAVAYHPDANFLALGGADGSVSIADLSNQQPIADAFALRELEGPIRALAWTRAGDMLAAVSGDESLKLARRAGIIKLWEVDPARPWQNQLLLHYSFPYPLTALAFSADYQLLAVTGESIADKRAGLWIYRVDDGALLLAKVLHPAGGAASVVASPDRTLGDFVYSSGDSLYQIDVESGEDRRIYHQAGMRLPRFAFRRQVIPDAEALLALASIARNGVVRLRIANALNAYSPAAALDVAPADIAFSPDGRALAIAEPSEDRLLILGIADG